MTSTGAIGAPARVSGLSALTWSRIRWWAAAGGTVLTVALLAGGPFLPAPYNSWAGFVLICSSGIAAIASLAGRNGVPNEKREVAAGYTTLHRSHMEVPQVDERTGEVVRAAGQPFVVKAAPNAYRDEANGVPRPGLLRRVVPSAVAAVGPSVLLASIGFVVGQPDGIPRQVLGFGVIGVGLLYALVLGIGAIAPRRRLMRLRSAAPGEFAFTISSSSGFAPAMQALVPPGTAPDRELAQSTQATASGVGLTLWHGDPPRRIAFLPWSRVLSVQHDISTEGLKQTPRVVISFRPEGAGHIVVLPLAKPEANYLQLHSNAEVHWVAAELEQLRTSTTTARVL